MKKLLLILLISIFAFGKMEFTDPKPTFENPRLWLVRINNSDVHKVNHTINAINNVMKLYPTEAIKIAVILYANGDRVAMKDYDKKTLIRIKSLMDYDIEFIVCVNTMETMGWKKSQFIDGVEYVQAGIAEAIERVAHGWVDVTPY